MQEATQIKIKPFYEDYGIKKPMSLGHGFF
jgi:hypothetical protein